MPVDGAILPTVCLPNGNVDGSETSVNFLPLATTTSLDAGQPELANRELAQHAVRRGRDLAGLGVTDLTNGWCHLVPLSATCERASPRGSALLRIALVLHALRALAPTN